MRRVAGLGAAFLLIGLTATGCFLSPCLAPGSDCDPPAPVVVNGTDETITLYSVGAAGEAFLAELEPGAEHGVHLTPARDCMGNATLRARDSSGNEIASRAGLCREERWVVEAP